MKNDRKFCLLAFTALSLAACGGSSGNRSATNGKKVLTYLMSNDSVAYMNIANKIVSDFNEQIASEGYYIETETPGGDYYTSLGNKFAANSAPDIFFMEEGYFNAYAKYLLPLTSYLTSSSKLKTSDLWDINDFYKYNGDICCLIKDFSPDFMLIYNKTALADYNKNHPSAQFTISDTVPMSWHDFYKMTSAIQAYEGMKYGTSLGFEGVKHIHDLVQMTGTTMYTAEQTALNLSSEDLKEAFRFFCALQKDNATEFPTYYSLNQNSGKAPASYTSGVTTSEQEMFKQGKCFSIFNGLYAFASYGFYDVSFDYGVAPSPVEKDGDAAYGSTSAMVSHAIYKNSKYKDIAWRFLEYYQTEGIRRLAGIAYNIPGNKTIAGSDAFLKNDNPKVQAMSNYFYNFVEAGHCHPTIYNTKVSFSRVQTCFSTQLAKYYDGGLGFDDMLNEISKAVAASV